MKAMTWLGAWVCMAGVAFASDAEGDTSLLELHRSRTATASKTKGDAPVQVEVAVRFIEVDENDLAATGLDLSWQLDKTTVSLLSTHHIFNDRKEADDVVSALLLCKETEVLSAFKVATFSGMKATVKVVEECVFPKIVAITDDTKMTQEAVLVSDGFDTREVGVVFDMAPTWDPKKPDMITLELAPSIVNKPTWQKIPIPYVDANGKHYDSVEQPIFPVRNISATIQLLNGGTVVLGGMVTSVRQIEDSRIPLLWRISKIFGEKKEIEKKRQLLIFATAKIISPDGL